MIIRVFGPPGTGKTYFLNRAVFHMIGVENNTAYLQQYNINLPYKRYKMPEIAYISFMNSAVDELLSRLDVKRNYKRGMWGTLHGLALHLLISNKVIPRELAKNTFSPSGGLYWWRRKFTYQYGLAYDPDEEVKTLPGNQLFDGLSYAINVFYPKEQDMKGVLDKLYEVYDDPSLVALAEEWLKFKEKNKIIDFDDILIYAFHAQPSLNVPVLVVDEFQDFGPLQYEIFRVWAEGKDIVIVAGDEDQCVSYYNGSDPRFLVELPGLDSDLDAVLKQSFRLPKVIHEASQIFITTYVKYRYPKEFLPRDEVGVFMSVKLGYHLITDLALKFALKGRRVLILARTNALVRDIEKLLLNKGVEYYRFKTRATQVWRDFINRILHIIEAVQKRKKVSTTDLAFFFRFTKVPEDKVRELAKAFAKGNVPLDAYNIFKNPLAIIDKAKVVDFLGSQEKADLALEALKGILLGKIQKPKGRIYVETIHAAKGREGDVVILVDTITPRIYGEMSSAREDFEAEMRVWYVGMTRARHVLITVPLDIPVVNPLLNKAGFRVKEVIA